MTQHPESTSNSESLLDTQETLRLLAHLPAPESLEDRVHARIQHHLAMEKAAERPRGFWSLFRPAHRLQFAAAAALVLAVAGSTWTAFRSHGPGSASPAGAVHSSQPLPGILPDSGAGAGFGTAKAARLPATLNPIKVPPVPRKKPSANHHSDKPAAGTPAKTSKMPVPEVTETSASPNR